ncbi:MAG: polysaccharide deacetylase family protein [Frankiales bacterium]|nr:polysaccharide deacetylase family protein [Frankiales bacterium]
MTTLVLCYHSVGDWDHAMSVQQGRLRNQLELLVERGYRGNTFSSAVIRPRRGKWLVVTFDDGFRAVHDVALPVLSALGLPGTAYLPTAYIGGSRLCWPGFDPGPASAHDLEPMDAVQVRTLAAAGWEIGSHTRTHPLLSRLEDDVLRSELEGSREECEALSATSCASLAYPFGDVDARVADAARRAGYHTGASLAHSPGRPSNMQVPRVAVYRGDGDVRFRAKTFPPLRTAPLGLAVTGAHVLWRHVGGRPRSRSLT